jgi:hemolysin activation/secretion protein
MGNTCSILSVLRNFNSYLSPVCAATSFLAMAAAPTQVLAQNAPTRGELELPGFATDRGVPKRAVRQDAMLRAPCPFAESDLTMSVERVVFSGLGGAELPADVARSVSGISLSAGTYPVSVVCDLRDQANAALRGDHWIASAIIPQQEITGSLTLEIVTAKLSEIRVSGNAGPYAASLNKRLAALSAMDALNERGTERVLLLANDVPGLNLNMALQPAGTAQGEVIGAVAVNYQPWAFFFNARNYNASQIGRETVFGRFEYYGLTGLDDITFAGVSSTLDFEEQIILQAGHEFGLNSSGTRIGASFTQAWTRPSVPTLDLEADTSIARFEVKQALVRSAGLFADITGGFDYIDQTIDLGAAALSKDRLRTFFVRGDVTTRKLRPDGKTAFRVGAFAELRQGVLLFSATDTGPLGLAETGGISASRPFGNGQALVARGGLDLYGGLDRFGLRVRGEGQWTNDPLLNFDEYAVGNLTIGRGYDPGANSGDRALAFSVEPSVTIIDTAKFDLQAYGFYDWVRLENLDPGTPQAVRDLDSWGGGIRAILNKGMVLDVTYAKPLKPALFSDLAKPTERVLVSLTMQFPSLVR